MLRVLALLVLRVELGGGHAYRPINGCQYPREPFLRVAAPSSSSAVVRRTPSLHCPRPCTLSSGQAAHGDQTIGGQTRRDETRVVDPRLLWEQLVRDAVSGACSPVCILVSELFGCVCVVFFVSGHVERACFKDVVASHTSRDSSLSKGTFTGISQGCIGYALYGTTPISCVFEE